MDNAKLAVLNLLPYVSDKNFCAAFEVYLKYLIQQKYEQLPTFPYDDTRIQAVLQDIRMLKEMLNTPGRVTDIMKSKDRV